VLIRPDGYIAHISGRETVGAIDDVTLARLAPAGTVAAHAGGSAAE
jgi:hypothetical protein